MDIDISTSFVYKYSRHPQYLGFLIFSYGFLLFVPHLNNIRGGFRIAPTLPWLIAALALIGSALVEEMDMLKKHGSQYQQYIDSTPFLFPLPGFVLAIILSPIRLILWKDRPETKREVLLVLFIYGTILALLSIPVALLSYH
jgi:hypothetical protein